MTRRNTYVVGKAITPTGGSEHQSSDLRYGWCSFQSQCIQIFNRAPVFLVVVSIGYFVQSMVVNGMTGVVLSTLEKRFGLSSILSGLIPGAYDLAGACILIFVTYIGEHSHKPRIISISLFLFALGSFTFALPHFLTGVYKYNNNRPSGIQCVKRTDDNSTLMDVNSICNSVEVERHSTHFLFLFLLGHILHGIGANPLQTLGLTYMDDCVRKESAALYYGIFYAIGSLGPAAGVLGGGALLDVFTDFGVVGSSSITITKDDPRWVGAWWMPFLFCGGLALLVVLPMSGFPRDLPGAAELRKAKVSEAHDVKGGAVANREDFGKTLKDLPLSLKLLVKNPVFMLTALAQVTEGFVGGSVINFGPKYLENQFSMPTSQSGMIFGAVAVVAGAGAMLLGSIIITKFKMSCSAMLKTIVVFSVVNLGLVSAFLIECPNVAFAGVTTGYNSSTSVGESMTHACNMGCQCLQDNFDPVCGDDNILYFSACYAGCQGDITHIKETYDVNTRKKFSDCACVALNTLSATQHNAMEGVCEAKRCHWVYLFAALIFLAVALSVMGALMSITVVMRCVPANQRSISLGLFFCFIRLFGNIPGPIIVGYILDTSCILWNPSCSKTSSCVYYSNHAMARRMLFVMAGFKICCLVLTSAACRIYKPVGQTDTPCGQVISQQMIAAESTSNGYAGHSNGFVIASDFSYTNPALELQETSTHM